MRKSITTAAFAPVAAMAALVLTASCSAPKHAQITNPHFTTQVATASESDQPAQAASSSHSQAVSDADFVASSDLKTVAPVAKSSAELDAVIAKVAEKDAKAAVKLKEVAAKVASGEFKADNTKRPSLVEKIVAKKVAKKLAKKDGKDVKAAQADSRTLIIAGAVSGILGLILLIVGGAAGSGALALVGLLLLIVGLVLVLVGALDA